MNNLENFDMRLELFLKNKMTEEETARITEENAKRFFSIA